MVEGKYRSRTKRRVSKRVSSCSKIVYKDRAKSSHKCAACKKQLLGVANKKRLKKTDKTVSRPYGGNLCTTCMRRVFIDKARQEVVQ